MHVAFIVNPKAGHGRGPALAAHIPTWCRGTAIKPEVWLTAQAGDGTRLARQAAQAGYDAVIAVGGDGTAREVGIGLLGTQAALGILPLGSGNGLARHLGIYLPPRLAVESLTTLFCSPMDVGFLNEQPFFMAMGMGLDAEVALRFAQAGRRGLRTYIEAGWQAYQARQPIQMSVRTDAGNWQGLMLGLTAANASQYGNNAFVAPAASLSDGKLVLTQIGSLDHLRAIEALGGLFSKNLPRLPFVQQVSFRQAHIQTAGAVAYHLDGEAMGHICEAHITVQMGALRVLHLSEFI